LLEVFYEENLGRKARNDKDEFSTTSSFLILRGIEYYQDQRNRQLA